MQQNTMAKEFLLDQWLVRPSLNRLEKHGQETKLAPKFMQLLVFMSSKPGQLFTREQLLNEVWPEVHVVDAVLTRAVSELRRSLDPDGDGPVFIETIPKSGYRLVATVTEVPEPAEPERARIKRRQSLRMATAVLFVAAVLLHFLFMGFGAQKEPETATATFSSYRLTQIPGEEFEPSVSPDGQWIAYARYAEQESDYLFLEVRNLTTGNTHKVWEEGYHLRAPRWSPDGTRLAYRRDDQSNSFVSTLNWLRPGAGTPTHIPCSACEGLFDWASETSLLVAWPAASGQNAIHAFDLATGAMQQLTFPGPTEQDTLPVLLKATGNVAFVRQTGNRSRILQVDLLGGQPETLAEVDSPVSGLASAGQGSSVYFIAQESLWRSTAEPETPQWITLVGQTVSSLDARSSAGEVILSQAVYDIDVQGVDFGAADAVVTTLVDTAEVSRSPSFSADGSKLAFLTNQPGRCEVWIENMESSARQLVHVFDTMCARSAELRWYTDSTHLLLLDEKSNGRLKVSLEGDMPTALTKTDTPPLQQPSRFTVEEVEEGRGRIVRLPEGDGEPEVVSPLELRLFDGFQYSVSDVTKKIAFTAQGYVGSDLVVLQPLP